MLNTHIALKVASIVSLVLMMVIVSIGLFACAALEQKRWVCGCSVVLSGLVALLAYVVFKT